MAKSRSLSPRDAAVRPRFIPALVLLAGCGCLPGMASAQNAVWNWESPHVHPIALTPSGQTLLAVNTADNRLEMFDVSSGVPVSLASIAVGLDPVSVRCVSNTEAWVVNRISDSVSVIDLASRRVTRTIGVGDEPCDVVFAGGRAFVSVSEQNQVRVWDLSNLGAAPTVLAIQGEDPRSLAVSPDGTTVYAGIFHSGNKTTAVRAEVVSQVNSPYAGQNPPPNVGNTFNPPINASNPPPPPVAMIVRQNASGQWFDDNNRNWSSFVTWGLNDQDVAIINTASLGVTYARGLMTTVMGVGVKPDGTVTAVGTEALNQVRFEPVVNSVFIRAQMASFSPAAPATVTTLDLNPHLNYVTRTLPEAQREESVGDPRSIVWLSNSKGYIAGMGSNNVVIVDGSGARAGRIDVGQGPTGVALNAAANRAFVLNRFDGTISTIDTSSDAELSRVAFFDPTPSAVRLGRPLLYDTHLTSGLGQASCGACHIDARNDSLAWDLGDPAGAQKTVNQPCRQGPGNCDSWSPMKGPMITQTLLGTTNGVALHWRGDRENIAAFNVAYTGLQGLPTVPSAADMQRFTDFLATIRFAPNPNRNLDGSLIASLPSSGGGTGNAITGQNVFNTVGSLGPGGGLTCRACHTNPQGSSVALDDPDLPPEPQTLKISPLMDVYERTGMSFVSFNNNRGFGFNHDSTNDTLFNLLGPPFNFGPGGAQARRDVEAFMLSFGTDTHPSVGQQETLDGTNNAAPNVVTRLTTFQNLANANTVGLIAKRVVAGVERGFLYLGASGNAQPDLAGQTTTWSALLASATAGSPITVTVVPRGTERRIAIDRDSDGAFDGDELLLGYNPADGASVPPPCPADLNGDNATNTADLTIMLGSFGQSVPAHTAGDINGDGAVNTQDLAIFLARFGGC